MFKKLKGKSWKFRAIVWWATLLIGGVIAILWSKFWNSEISSDDYIANDMLVQRNDVINELTMNWKANFSNAQKLTFPESGKIVAVYKKVWDEVKAWEIIAKMDTFEIDNELEQALIDLENEERRLSRAQDSSKTELEILQAQKKYKTAQYDEENAQWNLDLEIQTIENEYVNTKNTYEQMLKDYEQKEKDFNSLKDTYEEIIGLDKADSILSSDDTLKEQIRDIKDLAESILKEIDALDKLMYYSEKYSASKENPAYLYIWSYNLDTKVKTERYRRYVYSWANSVYNRAKDVNVDKLSDIDLKAELIQQYEEMKNVADNKTLLSEYCEKMFEESTTDEDITRTPVVITNGRSLKSNSNKAIDEILWLTAPDTIWEKKKKELDNLDLELQKMKQELDKLKISYDQAELQKQQKIDAAKLDFQMRWLETKIAKSELEDILAWNQDAVAEIKNSIKQKQKTIATIRKKYDNYTLKANFDWVITKMNMQVWDGVWASNTNDNNEKYVYVENPNNLEIILDIDQTDIVKLEVWKEVNIFLDALPGSVYTWILTEIDTTWWGGNGYDYWWSTSYKAKVIFTKKEEDTILWSMTATVNIVLEKAENVIVAPNIAISYDSKNFQSIVMKVVDGKYKKTPIEIWISDMANTEILGGLEEWDVIMWVFVDKDGMEAIGITDETIDPRANMY